MFRPAEFDRTSAVDVSGDIYPIHSAGAQKLGEELEALGRSFGFRFFLLGLFPKGDRPEFAANLLLTNWPDNLRDAYEAVDPLANSIMTMELKQSMLPRYSSEVPFLSSQQVQARDPLLDTFVALGFNGTVSLSLHDRNLTHIFLAYSGCLRKPERHDMAALHYGVLELLQSGVDQLLPSQGPREKLSAREIECLRWSAAGKSSDEIAIILNISSHTVVSYLKSAMRKLEAVNRMQAVARACRFRLL
ncbi:autoinducer binding domain-containing protein [Peteryoungia desertarenae]|uniref:Autoinducer binding domain-containing protein n=1 Tax=Peteryoungia desertarenae TaxID=1813451 RepID=A0ABX6QS69_9HYPH|nr:LuxR family transcriptional regulator [Peteryoungia desertarenae]QLF71116.1 autoinducer binding domain-containing protein [Peteryoungia desertarenae]